MAVAIVFISLFATAFGIWFYYLKTRNSERLALIQSGADASLFYSRKKNPNNSMFLVLILGMVFFAVGLGILTGHFIENMMIENYRSAHPDSFRRYSFPEAYFTAIFIFTGLGLVSSYFLIRKLNRKNIEDHLPLAENRD